MGFEYIIRSKLTKKEREVADESAKATPGRVLVGMLSFYGKDSRWPEKGKVYEKLEKNNDLATVDLSDDEIKGLVDYITTQIDIAKYGLKDKLNDALIILNNRLQQLEK